MMSLLIFIQRAYFRIGMAFMRFSQNFHLIHLGMHIGMAKNFATEQKQ